MKKVVNKREQSAYHINITFPGGKFIQKTDLSLDGLFNTYFIKSRIPLSLTKECLKSIMASKV